MKTRIIGVVLLAAVLGGLYVLLGESSPSGQSFQQAPKDDSAFKNLNIN